MFHRLPPIRALVRRALPLSLLGVLASPVTLAQAPVTEGLRAPERRPLPPPEAAALPEPVQTLPESMPESLPTLPAGPVPAIPTQDPVTGTPFVTGGVGASEQEAMRALRPDYNLHLLFAVAGSGAYLSDVEVRIQDSRGAVPIDTRSQGPYLFARLEAGQYRLDVSHRGSIQTRNVSISPGGTERLDFYWAPEQTPLP